MLLASTAQAQHNSWPHSLCTGTITVDMFPDVRAEEAEFPVVRAARERGGAESWTEHTDLTRTHRTLQC